MDLVSLDVLQFLADLSIRRPVFHSEADFQHALAWQIHTSHPEAEVRLEVPVEIAGRRMYVDMIVEFKGTKTFLELKYKTAASTVDHRGEHFMLKQQGAADQGLYDCVKDFSRLENFIDAHASSEGFAVLLTNDPRYWRPGQKENSLDREFKLTEGRELAGKLSWAAHAGAGSIKDRELPIELRGKYGIAWRDYSALSQDPKSSFRLMVLKMQPYVAPANAV